MSADVNYEYRTGIGTDIHRLVAGRPLFLGGVSVPYPSGLWGHSDGDAVLHAVIDALLGAAAMGDIGTLFPDVDPKWKDIDSKELMRVVVGMLGKKGWEIVNVDLIVHAQEPRLEPFKGQMKRSVSGLLGIDFNNVNVKAKTAEGLGAVGEAKAIAATATAMIRGKSKK